MSSSIHSLSSLLVCLCKISLPMLRRVSSSITNDLDRADSTYFVVFLDMITSDHSLQPLSEAFVRFLRSAKLQPRRRIEAEMTCTDSFRLLLR